MNLFHVKGTYRSHLTHMELTAPGTSKFNRFSDCADIINLHKFGSFGAIVLVLGGANFVFFHRLN